VRIEDVDLRRARARAADAILASLEHYGFEWDDRPWRQSTRTDAYEAALASLVANGVAYACICTRRELASLPASAIGERIYPGTCRDRAISGDAARTAIRVRVPSTPIAFTDRVFGLQQQQLDVDVGDFIVQRSDRLFAYQLAVVVDDAAQGITDIVRGADLLTSSPRQIFLQHALGLATPRYLHVPVAVDANGAKLSKQTAAAALPQEPLPALLSAWSFLGQMRPPASLASTREFWSWAIGNWQTRRISRVSTQTLSSPNV
jgi:glutamyl-Q tRNA(Asp) synthetase